MLCEGNGNIHKIYCLNCNKSTQSYTVVVFYGFSYENEFHKEF